MNRLLTGFLRWAFLVLFVAAMTAGFVVARSFFQPKPTPGAGLDQRGATQ